MTNTEMKLLLESWPLRLPRVELEPSKTVLLIIDMQNVYVDPKLDFGAFSRRDPDVFRYYYGRLETEVIPNLRNLIEFFRRNDLRVVYVANGAELQDRSDLTWLRRKSLAVWEEATNGPMDCAPGSYGYAICDALCPLDSEIVVGKRTFSAFTSSGIDQILRNLGAEMLVIGGVTTPACVETTARDAADRGYLCILLEDGCAAFHGEEHQATMRVFARVFGRVATSRQVLQMLAQCLRTQSPLPEQPAPQPGADSEA